MMVRAPDPAAVKGQSSSDPHLVATAETMLDAGPRSSPGAAGATQRSGQVAVRRRPPRLDRWAGAGLLAVIAVVGGAVALRGTAAVDALEQTSKRPAGAAAAAAPGEAPRDDDGDKEPAPPPTSPTPEELDAARRQGTAALAAMAERFPRDPGVLRALALAQGAERSNLLAAVATIKRLLEVAPAEATSADLKPILLRAANATPDVAAAALEVMARQMGSRGPDLLYEIASNTGLGKHPQERASALLAEEAVRKLATPALLVADDLRRVKQCPTKALVERARQHGDGRALATLNPIKQPKKCGVLGWSRCTSCNSVYADVVKAIAAIEQRRDAK